MKSFFLVISFSVLSINSFAEEGKCGAKGRVAGENLVCAQYDNTDAQTCKQADGRAWCFWEKAEVVIGTGPIHVTCQNEKLEVIRYRVNRVVYSPTGKSKLTAFGLGPNRQDDRAVQLTGLCEISERFFKTP